MRIFVGNLAYGTTSDQLLEAFKPFGQVSSAEVVTDRSSGESKGFGFVEMPTNDEARSAIAALDRKDLDGRAVTVNEARPRGDLRRDRR